MQNKPFITILLSLLFSLLLYFPSHAQGNSGMTMEIEPAFEGHFKFGEWLPVWVEIENDGPDRKAEVHVKVTGRMGASTYAAPLELPSGSRKRIPVYVLPNSYSKQLEVTVVEADMTGDEATLLSQEISVKPLPNITYLIGLITAERGALSLIASAPLPKDARDLTVIDVALNRLPEQAEALNSFDLLILNDVDTSNLTPEQSNALTAWVLQGGHLIIGGGVNARQTVAGLSESLLPIRLDPPIESADLLSLATFANADAIEVPGPFVLSTSTEESLTQDTEMLIAAGIDEQTWPLMVNKPLGSGQVQYIALDLATSPFTGWTGTPQLWGQLLESEVDNYPDWLPADVSPRAMRAERLSYAISNLPTLDLPSVRNLGWLLILYILLVGPINYFILRWRRRLQWAWITIPILTIIFSVGAFSIGYAMRGTDLILNRIAIVEPQPATSADGENGQAQISSYMGLFSPAQQSYEITVDSNGLVSPMSLDSGPWGPGGPSTTGEMLFLQGRPSQLRGLSVNQWSMQSFVVEEQWSDFGGIQGSFELGNGELRGELVNGLDQTVYDVTVVLGRYFERLGDLAAGETLPITLPFEEKIQPEWGPSIAWQIYSANEMPMGPGLPREDQLKQQIVEILFDPALNRSAVQSKGSANVSKDVILIGWLKETPTQITIAGTEPVQQTTALLHETYDFSVPQEGMYSLPTGLLAANLIEMSRNGGPCGGNSSIYMTEGEAVMEFLLPATMDSEDIRTFRLSLGGDGGPQMNMPEVAFYNWQTEGWSKLQDVVKGINVLSDEELIGLISDVGQVHVQLTAVQDTFGCVNVGLGLTVDTGS